MILAQITDAGLVESTSLLCNLIQVVALAYIAARTHHDKGR